MSMEYSNLGLEDPEMPVDSGETDPPKKTKGTNDWLGNGGSINYNGDALFGTNFIGPGPDIDPYLLKSDGLLPLDMLDQAAFEHDVAYYKANTGGVKGAVKNLDVAGADKALVESALSIIRGYRKGRIDPITGEKISERTRNAAKLVYMAFKPIVSKKTSTMNVNAIVNNFYNNLINSIAKHH